MDLEIEGGGCAGVEGCKRVGGSGYRRSKTKEEGAEPRATKRRGRKPTHHCETKKEGNRRRRGPSTACDKTRAEGAEPACRMKEENNKARGAEPHATRRGRRGPARRSEGKGHALDGRRRRGRGLREEPKKGVGPRATIRSCWTRNQGGRWVGDDAGGWCG